MRKVVVRFGLYIYCQDFLFSVGVALAESIIDWHKSSLPHLLLAINYSIVLSFLYWPFCSFDPHGRTTVKDRSDNYSHTKAVSLSVLSVIMKIKSLSWNKVYYWPSGSLMTLVMLITISHLSSASSHFQIQGKHNKSSLLLFDCDLAEWIIYDPILFPGLRRICCCCYSCWNLSFCRPCYQSWEMTTRWFSSNCIVIYDTPTNTHTYATAGLILIREP